MMKFLERWSRMGVRRSSSSSLGSARAVSYEVWVSVVTVGEKDHALCSPRVLVPAWT